MRIPAPKFEPILSESIWTPQRYRLTEDWTITLDDGLPLVFPRGFITDLASIPRPMWALPGFSPTGPLLYGSIPHDFGYQYQYLLTPYLPANTYPEPSMRLREQFPDIFRKTIPIFVGRNQRFFDDLLAGITIEATGQTFIARSAEVALVIFGAAAWDKYRSVGPTAYNTNSLDLPGITARGPVF